VSEVY